MANLVPFSNGQTVLGIDFGNVQNGDTSSAMDSFLNGLTYEDGQSILVVADEQGTGTDCFLAAVSAEGAHALVLAVGGNATILYSDVTDVDFGSAGWKNLSDGKCSVQTPLIINIVSAEEGWNGVLMGAVTDTPVPPAPEDEDSARVGYCITPNVTSDKVVKVLVPEGGLTAGQVVNLVSLASNVDGVDNNLEVWTATLPTTSTLGSKHIAMIVNGGLETLADGRRPDGQPDYTKYTYLAGDVCTAVIMDKNLIFEISGSAISGDTKQSPASDIGKYIVPVDGSYTMAMGSEPTNGNCLKVIGTKYFYRGGLFASAYTQTYVAVAYN